MNVDYEREKERKEQYFKQIYENELIENHDSTKYLEDEKKQLSSIYAGIIRKYYNMQKEGMHNFPPSEVAAIQVRIKPLLGKNLSQILTEKDYEAICKLLQGNDKSEDKNVHMNRTR